MKKLIFILIMIVAGSANAQYFNKNEQFKVDSLSQIIKSNMSHDTVKVMSLMHLATYYYTFDLDTTEQICNTACQLAEKTNFSDGMAESYGWLGYLAQVQGDSKKGIVYQYKSLNLQLQVGRKDEVALAYNNLAGSYETTNQTDSALTNYKLALKNYAEVNNLLGVSLVLNNIGGIYTNQGKFISALECLALSLKIRENINDQDGIAYCLNNIGYLYDTQGDYKNALLHYHKSLKIRQDINDVFGTAMSLNNIGYLFVNLKVNDSALFYLNKSLAIQEEIDDQYGIAYSLNNIASIYRNTDSTELAILYYQKSLNIFENIQDNEGVSMVLNNLGNIHFKNKNYGIAERSAKTSFDIATQIGYPDDIMASSELLSSIYENQERGMDALEMYKLFIEMRDSLNNTETQKASITQQTKYEYEKQKLIDDLENTKKLVIEKEEKQRQKSFTISALIGLVLVGIFLIIIFNRLQLTKKQKVVIETQKEEVENQKEIIEETHREITDSIRYAKRLQDAILPSNEGLSAEIPQSFVLFQPKDVVSGDFYWLEKKDEIVYLAVADCTGHGVPGAMVSVVCSNALNRSLKEFGITEPKNILNKTRELVIETFAKSGENIQDGMDISLCAFGNNKIIFSGANNPLWIVKPTHSLTPEQKNRKGTLENGDLSLIEIKGNKQPVGLYHKMNEFTQTEIPYQKGDSIYLFTDGFADQFGGMNGKKFKYQQFKQLLLQINQTQFKEQAEVLKSTINTWKGDLEQIDDICVIGIKIS